MNKRMGNLSKTVYPKRKCWRFIVVNPGGRRRRTWVGSIPSNSLRLNKNAFEPGALHQGSLHLQVMQSIDHWCDSEVDHPSGC